MNFYLNQKLYWWNQHFLALKMLRSDCGLDRQLLEENASFCYMQYLSFEALEKKERV